MTKEESEKFRGLPGVLFVLADSYVDQVNKEYGGDKYINGTVIPRPPPGQYAGRQVRKDRSGNLDQPRYERPATSTPNRQANPSFNQQGSIQGDECHSRASQNYSPQGPSQNYGPLELRETRDHSPMNTSALEGRDYYQGGRGPMPSHRGNYNPRVQEIYNYDMQGNYPSQREQIDYMPPPIQSNYGSGFTQGLRERRDYSPMNTYAPEARDSYQGGRGPMPYHQVNYNQRGYGSYNHEVQGNYLPQGEQRGHGCYNHEVQGNYLPRGEQRDYVLPPGQSTYGSDFTQGLREKRDHSPMNTSALEGRDSYQGGRGPMPSHRGNYNQRVQEIYNYDMQGNYWSQREQIDYMPPPSQSNYGSGFTRGLQERREYSPMNTYAPEVRDSYQGGRGPMPYHQVNDIQRVQESYNCDVQGNYHSQREQIDYVPPLGQSNYGSGFTRGIGERRNYSPMNTYATEGRDSYQGGRGPIPYPQVNYNQRGHGSYEGRDSYQGGRGPIPYHQVNYNQRGHGSYNHDVQRNYFPQGEHRDYMPPLGPSNYGSGGLGERRDYSPMNTYIPKGRDSYYGGRGLMPYHAVNYSQRGQGNYTHDMLENCLPQGEQRDYVPRLGQRIFSSGFNSAQGGPYEQGRYRGHGAGMPYGQGQYPSSIEGQRFSPGFQRNMQEERRNYISCGQTWDDQWKF